MEVDYYIYDRLQTYKLSILLLEFLISIYPVAIYNSSTFDTISHPYTIPGLFSLLWLLIKSCVISFPTDGIYIVTLSINYILVLVNLLPDIFISPVIVPPYMDNLSSCKNFIQSYTLWFD